MPHLVPLEMVIFDALTVHRDAFGGDDFLGVGQKFGGRWQVRKHKQGKDAQRNADAPEDDEDVHPTSEPCRDVANSIPD